MSIWSLSGSYPGRGVRSVESGGSRFEPRETCAASSGVGEPLSCPAPTAPAILRPTSPPRVGPGPVLGPREGKPPESGLGLGADTDNEFIECGGGRVMLLCAP
ncbi:hypothetical protein GSI_12756 [Ganoderma sinense ZZ0214-1]|uniref:Uncharacterized protein n=1 Tax=Ganoderma sinense ZZ0214-1 TaxID=1077348 RepID=A0A2G8RTP2_9APHY|nr:hypothetical protein GSI_12756 [Ganoderma sinense ZZ0214-1]